MSADKFIFDLGEFEEEVVEEQASQERVKESKDGGEKREDICVWYRTVESES